MIASNFRAEEIRLPSEGAVVIGLFLLGLGALATIPFLMHSRFRAELTS